VTEFSTGLTVANAPADITTGPDGNLWFTEQGIGRITPTGSTVTLETGTPPWPGLLEPMRTSVAAAGQPAGEATPLPPVIEPQCPAIST
jgi:hypothetical protein